MAKFIVKRIFYIALVLFMVSFGLFMLFRTMPGDPVDMFLPPEVVSSMEPAQVAIQRAQIIEEMALDRPHVIQYVIWIRNVFRGDFGISMDSRMPVLEHIRQPMTNTIVMNILNIIIVFSVSIPIGIYCAIKRGKAFDNFFLVTSMIGFSIPGFLFALILIFIFSIWLGVLPMFGMASTFPPPVRTVAWFVDRLRHMILPLTAIALVGIANMIRFVRSAMLDALSMDCIRTARAKGLSEKTVIYVHAFRNALIPIITVFGGFFITVFAGTMVIEGAFQWQGMGQIMLVALNMRDIMVLMAMNVFYAFIAFVVIMILDLIYVLVDPRIRYS